MRLKEGRKAVLRQALHRQLFQQRIGAGRLAVNGERIGFGGDAVLRRHDQIKDTRCTGIVQAIKLCTAPGDDLVQLNARRVHQVVVVFQLDRGVRIAERCRERNAARGIGHLKAVARFVAVEGEHLQRRALLIVQRHAEQIGVGIGFGALDLHAVFGIIFLVARLIQVLARQAVARLGYDLHHKFVVYKIDAARGEGDRLGENGRVGNGGYKRALCAGFAVFHTVNADGRYQLILRRDLKAHGAGGIGHGVRIRQAVGAGVIGVERGHIGQRRGVCGGVRRVHNRHSRHQRIFAGRQTVDKDPVVAGGSVLCRRVHRKIDLRRNVDLEIRQFHAQEGISLRQRFHFQIFLRTKKRHALQLRLIGHLRARKIWHGGETQVFGGIGHRDDVIARFGFEIGYIIRFALCIGLRVYAKRTQHIVLAGPQTRNGKRIGIRHARVSGLHGKRNGIHIAHVRFRDFQPQAFAAHHLGRRSRRGIRRAGKNIRRIAVAVERRHLYRLFARHRLVDHGR